MTLDEIKEFLQSENGKTQEVNEYLSTINPTTLEKAQQYVETTPEAKSWLDSIKDKHLQKGLETWKSNNLQSLINDEIKVRFPQKSDQDIEVENLKAEINKIKQEKERETLSSKAMKIATEKNLPIDLVGFFIGSTEEETQSNIDILQATFNNAVQKSLEDRLKTNGYTPHKETSGAFADLENLSMNDYIKARNKNK